MGCVEEERGTGCERDAFVGWTEEDVELWDGVCGGGETLGNRVCVGGAEGV